MVIFHSYVSLPEGNDVQVLLNASIDSIVSVRTEEFPVKSLYV